MMVVAATVIGAAAIILIAGLSAVIGRPAIVVVVLVIGAAVLGRGKGKPGPDEAREGRRSSRPASPVIVMTTTRADVGEAAVLRRARHGALLRWGRAGKGERGLNCSQCHRGHRRQDGSTAKACKT